MHDIKFRRGAVRIVNQQGDVKWFGGYNLHDLSKHCLEESPVLWSLTACRAIAHDMRKKYPIVEVICLA